MGTCRTPFLLALLLVFSCGPFAHAQEPPLNFGVFPRWNATITVRDFTPLAQALGAALGREVRVETDKDYDAFMRRVFAGEFDIVHMNQLQCVQARERNRYRTLAKLCDNDNCTIRAIIVVRADSGLQRIEDLHDRTIAFAGPTAMVSYVLSKSVLRNAGLQDADYRTVYTKSPPNALLAVYNGTADAAGVGSPLLLQPDITGRLDTRALRTLAESSPIPQLPVAVRMDMDPALARRILDTLLGLADTERGKVVLATIGTRRFVAADDREYAALRRFIPELADATR